jgi:hypothetical protein
MCLRGFERGQKGTDSELRDAHRLSVVNRNAVNSPKSRSYGSEGPGVGGHGSQRGPGAESARSPIAKRLWQCWAARLRALRLRLDLSLDIVAPENPVKTSTLGDRMCSHAEQGCGRSDLIGQSSLWHLQILSRNWTEPSGQAYCAISPGRPLTRLRGLYTIPCITDYTTNIRYHCSRYLDNGKIVGSMMLSLKLPQETKLWLLCVFLS